MDPRVQRRFGSVKKNIVGPVTAPADIERMMRAVGERERLSARTDEILALRTERPQLVVPARTVAWTVQGKRANHLFDCEVYAATMADPECDGGVMVLASPTGPDVQKRQRRIISKGISV